MHEIGIIDSVLATVVKTAQDAGATRVHSVRIQVGAMTGIVTDSLQFAFEALRTGTLAAEAVLEVEEVAAACWCEPCQQEFVPDRFMYNCPRCQHRSSELRHGQELQLISVEVS
jgi:hydrogenase nickel incorporation protein HypA/HybF